MFSKYTQTRTTEAQDRVGGSWVADGPCVLIFGPPLALTHQQQEQERVPRRGFYFHRNVNRASKRCCRRSVGWLSGMPVFLAAVSADDATSAKPISDKKKRLTFGKLALYLGSHARVIIVNQ